MAKKNKKKKATVIEWEDHPEVHKAVNKKSWDFITMVNKQTAKFLADGWEANIKENLDLWEQHAALIDDCIGFGKNKAIVAVGAGQSFNLNKDVLKKYLNIDGRRNWEDRSFITIASNHQYKPLLNMGIIPDFVLLCDGSDVVYDQLNTDIHDSGKNTILIAGMHCSPKVLHEWSKQGRSIRFYLNMAQQVQEEFYRVTKKYPKKYLMEMGGNVINGAWAISIKKMYSNVFLCVGNDLSYPIHNDIEEQRSKYYADGDYSSNDKVTGTGRDEAAKQKKWLGINMKKRVLFDINQPLRGIDRYDVDLRLVGTSHTLWVYKTWLESTLISQLKYEQSSFHYFNCSEAGILGVMAKEDNDEALRRDDNWYMLDDVCKFYHTAMLEDAIKHFEKCKGLFECQKYGVPNAITLAARG